MLKHKVRDRIYILDEIKDAVKCKYRRIVIFGISYTLVQDNCENFHKKQVRTIRKRTKDDLIKDKNIN